MFELVINSSWSQNAHQNIGLIACTCARRWNCHVQTDNGTKHVVSIDLARNWWFTFAWRHARSQSLCMHKNEIETTNERFWPRHHFSFTFITYPTPSTQRWCAYTVYNIFSGCVLLLHAHSWCDFSFALSFVTWNRSHCYRRDGKTWICIMPSVSSCIR